MSGFKKLKNTDKLVLKQRGGAVVFLESEADFQIVAERWFFDEGQDILFKPADAYEPGPGGGGCKAVIDLVHQARADGITAFGLVDRDVLLSDHDWVLWWQEQDLVLQAARPYGDYIRVLVRWELENYLLDPEAMATVSNDARMTSTHTPLSAANSCLNWADELKDRSAATVAAIAAGLAPPAAGFGCGKTPLRGTDLTVALHQSLANQGMTNPAAAVSSERQRIDQFDAPGTPAPHRWDRLVRMLDGKAALKYIGHHSGVRFDERRAELARRMRERGSVPAEIRSHVDDFKSAA